MNLFETVELQARTRPHGVALVEADQTLGYAEAVELSYRIAGALRRRGVGESDVVGLMLGNTLVHLLVLLGLARLGAVAVSLPPSLNEANLEGFCTRFRPRLVLGFAAARQVHGAVYVRVGPWLEQTCDDAERSRPHAEGDDRTFKIALSSGTTGRQKAISWSHQRMLALLELQRTVRPFGPGVRLLPLMGFDATVAADTALRQLCAGGTVVVTRRIGYADLVRAIDKLGATHVLSSPGIMARLLPQMPAGAQRFPDLGGLRLTGGLVSPELRAGLLQRVTSRVSVDYGASEVGVLAVGDPETFRVAPSSAGRIVPWVTAEAVDDAGQPLPAGDRGLLRFRGETFPPAYLDDGGPILDADGWFKPGDIGRVDADGLLTVDTREDDVINLGGMKVLPAEVEEVLVRCPGVTEAAAYAMQTADGRPLLVAAVVCSDPWEPAPVLQRCRRELGQRAPSHLVRVRQLPRNEMGKVLRRELIRRTRIEPA
ncbi:MAG: long-chain fatty acid--CoA ligase [Rubrivivax sp.]|nr:long-chain fatty acid--CoA ligase [Rubrivivax sp.]